MPQGHVYILASQRNGTLYIGVTNSLAARIHAHREGRGSVFTRTVVDAIQRETAPKRWKRNWKLELIEKTNPNWDDLYETLT